MKVFTIGFTKKNAETFFKFMKESSIRTLVDVRLNNVSQLAGFAKKDDLKYFLREICGAEYVHVPEFTPTKDILDAYKDGELTWDAYADKFMNLMSKRNVERAVKSELLDHGCLLCSEHEPHQCHRRLVVEYLNRATDMKLEIKHLY